MALASTIFIVNPCIDIWGWSEGQGEQFGTHIGLLGPSGRYGYFWLHIWAGRGFEPVRRRCPETPPKVRTMHGATSGGPNSELIKALKKFAPPPLKCLFYLISSDFDPQFELGDPRKLPNVCRVLQMIIPTWLDIQETIHFSLWSQLAIEYSRIFG